MRIQRYVNGFRMHYKKNCVAERYRQLTGKNIGNTDEEIKDKLYSVDGIAFRGAAWVFMGESEANNIAKLVRSRLLIRQRRFSVATEDFKRNSVPHRRPFEIWMPQSSNDRQSMSPVPARDQKRAPSRSVSPQQDIPPARRESVSVDRPPKQDRFASQNGSPFQESRKPRGRSLSPERASSANNNSQSQLKVNENSAIIRSLLTARAQSALSSAEINSKHRSIYYLFLISL